MPKNLLRKRLCASVLTKVICAYFGKIENIVAIRGLRLSESLMPRLVIFRLEYSSFYNLIKEDECIDSIEPKIFFGIKYTSSEQSHIVFSKNKLLNKNLLSHYCF